MTSSEAFVESLVKEGITVAYGIVGSAYEDPLDMFPDAGIRFIPVAHEQAAAHAADGMARVTGKPPKAPLAGVRMAKHKMFFNPDKAIRELGLPQTPPKQALKDAVDWFHQNGYV